MYEALDLEAFMSKLSSILSASNGSKADNTVFLPQLPHKLRSNIRLPERLRIVAHLRRMGVFSKS